MSKIQKTDSKHTQTRLLPNRIDKALDWLERSRDDWKDKCLAAKLELKMKTLSVKRLRDGRNKWKHLAKQMTKTIQQMKKEQEDSLNNIEKLKYELAVRKNEIEDLKKKS